MEEENDQEKKMLEKKQKRLKKKITVTILLNGYPTARARLGVGLDELLIGLHPPCTLKVLWVHLQIKKMKSDWSHFGIRSISSYSFSPETVLPLAVWLQELHDDRVPRGTLPCMCGKM